MYWTPLDSRGYTVTCADAVPESISGQVRSSVDGFVQEAEQFDDLTMLCLELRGKDVGL